jgi:hypothetical protein
MFLHFGDGPVEAIPTDVNAGNTGAFLRQSFSDRATDTTRRSSDRGHASFQAAICYQRSTQSVMRFHFSLGFCALQ